MKPIHDTLKNLRRNAHITQTHVADALGVSTSTVCRMEGGSQLPTLEQLPVIADTLGIPLSDLLAAMYDLDSAG